MSASLNTTHLTNMASSLFTSVSGNTVTLPSAAVYAVTVVIGASLVSAGIASHHNTQRRERDAQHRETQFMTMMQDMGTRQNRLVGAVTLMALAGDEESEWDSGDEEVVAATEVVEDGFGKERAGYGKA